MEDWLFGGLAVFLIGSIGLLVFLHYRQQRRRWAELLLRLDLQQVGRARFGLRYDLELAGRWRGVAVRYRLRTRGRGRGSVTFGTVEARVPAPLPAGMEISREGLADRVAKTLGGEDLELGGDIDRLLRVRAAERQAAYTLLQEVALRGALRRLLERHRTARVVDGRVFFKERAEGLPEPPALERWLDEVRDVALALKTAAEKTGLAPPA